MNDSVARTAVTCVIAERHPDVCESLVLLIEHEGFKVAGVAETGREAIRALEVHRPDFAVLDLRLPGLNGIEVAREAARLGLPTAAVIHTAEAGPSLVRKALAVGVYGLARKAVPPTALLTAIAAAVARETYVDPAFGISAPGSESV